MKLHRFIGNFDLSQTSLKLDDRELLNQLRNVLRLQTGSSVVLCDGAGAEAVATITGLHSGFVEMEIKEKTANANEAARNAHLYCAILKRENFELAVQKATEAGVRAITPLLTKRTVKMDVRRDRLEKIIKEAAEQSGRGMVPILHEAVAFEKALAALEAGSESGSAANILFDASGEVWQSAAAQPKSLGIWIGPEGGWEPGELEAARAKGFHLASLGPLTLRAETAATVASYLAVHAS